MPSWRTKMSPSNDFLPIFHLMCFLTGASGTKAPPSWSCWMLSMVLALDGCRGGNVRRGTPQTPGAQLGIALAAGRDQFRLAGDLDADGGLDHVVQREAEGKAVHEALEEYPAACRIRDEGVLAVAVGFDGGRHVRGFRQADRPLQRGTGDLQLVQAGMRRVLRIDVDAEGGRT